MLDTYEKFVMIDKAKKNDFFAEVNYDGESNPDSGKCKTIRFTFPDGREAFVERDHITQMIFAIGKPEDQRKLIPQKITRVHHYKSTVGVKATKDIAKGEMINFPVNFSVDCNIAEELIGELSVGGLKRGVNSLRNFAKNLVG